MSIMSRLISPVMPLVLAAQVIAVIARVERKSNAHELAISTMNIEVIGTPARVGLKRPNYAIMRAIDTPTSALLYEQLIRTHESINALVIGQRRTSMTIAPI